MRISRHHILYCCCTALYPRVTLLSCSSSSFSRSRQVPGFAAVVGAAACDSLSCLLRAREDVPGAGKTKWIQTDPRLPLYPLRVVFCGEPLLLLLLCTGYANEHRQRTPSTAICYLEVLCDAMRFTNALQVGRWWMGAIDYSSSSMLLCTRKCT